MDAPVVLMVSLWVVEVHGSSFGGFWRMWRRRSGGAGWVQGGVVEAQVGAAAINARAWSSRRWQGFGRWLRGIL